MPIKTSKNHTKLQYFFLDYGVACRNPCADPDEGAAAAVSLENCEDTPFCCVNPANNQCVLKFPILTEGWQCLFCC